MPVRISVCFGQNGILSNRKIFHSASPAKKPGKWLTEMANAPRRSNLLAGIALAVGIMLQFSNECIPDEVIPLSNRLFSETASAANLLSGSFQTPHTTTVSKTFGDRC